MGQLGGICRIPGERADDEVVKEFKVKCDSGCGYWQGRCGQTCCLPKWKVYASSNFLSLPGLKVNAGGLFAGFALQKRKDADDSGSREEENSESNNSHQSNTANFTTEQSNVSNFMNRTAQ